MYKYIFNIRALRRSRKGTIDEYLKYRNKFSVAAFFPEGHKGTSLICCSSDRNCITKSLSFNWKKSLEIVNEMPMEYSIYQ